MSDQADTLRKLMQQRKEAGSSSVMKEPDLGYPETILFAGGGKSVGTSFLMSQLGRELAGNGQKVLLIDHAQTDLASLPRMPRSCVIVTLPDPASVTGSVRLIRALRARRPDLRLGVIVNRVTCPGEARQTYLKLKECVEDELDREVLYLGHCVEDQGLIQAVLGRGGEARRCVEFLARRLALFSGEPSTL